MATLNPAKFLKVDKEIGMIEKGYRADLILMNLKDYSCTTVMTSSH
jgi:imidazolonepropionase-like amidohydrolase